MEKNKRQKFVAVLGEARVRKLEQIVGEARARPRVHRTAPVPEGDFADRVRALWDEGTRNGAEMARVLQTSRQKVNATIRSLGLR